MTYRLLEVRSTTFQLPGLGTRRKTHLRREGEPDGDFSSVFRYYRMQGKSEAAYNAVNDVWFATDASAGISYVRSLDWTGWQPARNRAYSRLVNKVNGNSSQLGVMFAEWRESQGMITKRAIGLRKAYQNLRKGRFRDFLKELSVSPKRKHRNKVRNSLNEASGLWLEYWFGWSPFLGDIYSACIELSDPIRTGVRIQGSSKDRSLNHVGIVGAGSDSTNDYVVRTGAVFALDNPNLYLASQLGLVNPATIAWEVIPFSFMVDWVADVSSFLESFSDFAGLRVINPYHNQKVVSLAENYQRSGGRIFGPSECYQTRFRRYNGLIRPLPNLGILRNLGQSKTRAATAVSLLVQVLKT